MRPKSVPVHESGSGPVQEFRTAVAYRYLDGLAPLAATGALQLPLLPAGTIANWHAFHVLLSCEADRDRTRLALQAAGIEASFHFQPLHVSPFAQARYGYRRGDLPVSEHVADRIVRLPIHTGVTPACQDFIVRKLRELFG